MKLTLTETRDEVENVKSFIFKPDIDLTWQPGQYLHYSLDIPNVDDKGDERWFTIATAPYEKNVMITTRLDNGQLSSFKAALCHIQPGDQIEADGPKGNFILKEGNYSHILIAGGIGITPFRSMLMQLGYDTKPSNAVLFYANKDDVFVYNDELSDLQSKDPSLEIRKIVELRLTKEDLYPLTQNDGSVFYLSGPKAMVESYADLLSSLGVSEDNLLTDYFPGY